MKFDFLKKLGGLALAATAVAALSAGDAEAKKVRWKMHSAFGKNVAVIGPVGYRIADMVREMSGGDFDIKVFEPGALAGGYAYYDPVSQGAFEAGYGTPGANQGKNSAFAFASTWPFGPGALEFNAWMVNGGGVDMISELYARDGIKYFYCGMIPPETSGWFREPIESLDQLKGLKMRFFGVGAKVMQKFGWPMGPAYLLDVVGIDTGVHAAEVMAEGFPDRMQHDFKDPSEIMFENERYGQKNGIGFYKYEEDKKGKPKKVVDEKTYELIKPMVTGESKEFDADDIIARMMIPMCTETIRCLEDNIVGSAAEADMAMIYGIGFPPFRGGPLRYIDSIGTKAFAELCDKYAHLGKLYEAPQMLKDKAAKGEAFFA